MTALHSDQAQPKRKRLSATQREAQLVDVAESLFIDSGYGGVTIEDIARTAHVTRPIIYQYFGSIEGAFLACVRRARTQFESDILQRISAADDDLNTRIRAGGAAYFDLIQSDPGRWNLLFTTSSSREGPLADELTALRARTVEAIAALTKTYAPELKDEAASAFAYAISGIGEQLGRWWLSKPNLPKATVLAYYTAAVTGAAEHMRAMPRAVKRRRKTN